MKSILQCFFTFCFRSKIVVWKIEYTEHKDRFLKHSDSISEIFRKLHAHVIDRHLEDIAVG